ncbi:MAG: MaoC/PaaZ C-terminal domain-containing protein [Alphaproteobacteria bacterium]
MTRYYEDFEVGQQLFSSEEYVISKESAVDFAREYDPQAQHIDDEMAKDSTFGQLVVSGWQTAAATMRLKTQTDLMNMAGGLIGIGLENVRWPRPTLPGDRLRTVITILEKRKSASRKGRGLIKYKAETFNQRDELAMELTITVIAPLKAQDNA